MPWSDDTESDEPENSPAATSSSLEPSPEPTRVPIPEQLRDLGPHHPLPENWADDLRAHRISYACVSPRRLSNVILNHCISSIDALRDAVGGRQLCVIKIGITHCIENRWPSYSRENFTHMRVVHCTMCLAQIEMLEAALISHFKPQMGNMCRNRNGGGEGMRIRGEPRHPPPYKCYVVAARADQSAPIGD